MDKLFFNLSEEEFTKGRKNLLWGFVVFFFFGGVYVLFTSLVLGHKSIPAILSLAPFGISFLVFVIALFATVKRSDMFFQIDDEKIEFRYGVFKPQKYSFKWADIKNLVMPHKQRKAKLQFKDGSSFIIDLSFIQKKKSSIIRKHIYHVARSKDLEVIKVDTLKKA
jgi:hypothetical protein